MKLSFSIIVNGLLFCLCSVFLQGQVPVFNGQNAYTYLKKQCAFGPRAPGSSGHRECLQFLVDELNKTTDRVTEQSFYFTDFRDQKTHKLTNIISRYGTHQERIVLCAHWDTRPVADFDPDPENRRKPILGANDGASGVAVLLEIAHILKKSPAPMGIDIVLFDGEDSGIQGKNDTWCLGSRYYANHIETTVPRYGILIDMVGDKQLDLPVEINSMRFVPDLVDRVWSKAEQLSLPAFSRIPVYEIVDDHLELLKAGIPSIVIIDFNYPYWHTLEDTEDKCSPESLWIVGTLLLHLIYE